MAEQVVKPSQLRRSMAYRPADGSWVLLPLTGLQEEGVGDTEGDEAVAAAEVRSTKYCAVNSTVL